MTVTKVKDADDYFIFSREFYSNSLRKIHENIMLIFYLSIVNKWQMFSFGSSLKRGNGKAGNLIFSSKSFKNISDKKKYSIIYMKTSFSSRY